MVAAIAADVSWVFRIYRLFNMGRVSRRALLVGTVPVADVFAPDMGSSRTAFVAPCVARRLAVVDAGMDLSSADHSGSSDPMGARWISIYLLLLSRCVLQSLLGRPAGMCGR